MSRVGSGLEDPACVFSPSGSILAVATVDGRLRTFDTGTGRLSVEFSGGTGAALAGSNLQEPVTCLSWAPLPSQQEDGEEEQSMLVAGTAGGAVVAFNALTGDQLWRQAGAHSGASTAVAYIGGLIYSVGADGKIISLDLGSGNLVETYEGDDISQTQLISPATGAANLLLAGAELYLYKLGLRRRLRWFSGHTMDAKLLAASRGGTFAVSAALSDRHLAVWDLGGKKPKKRKAQQSAAASLSMDQQATAIAASAGSAEDAAFHVAAAQQSGATLVWECRPQADGSVAAEVRARITAPSMGGNEAVLALRLEGTDEGATLVLVRGTTAKPAFQRVTIPASRVLELELEPIQDRLVASTAGRGKAAKEQVQPPLMASAETTALPGFPSASEPDEEVPSIRKRRADDDAANGSMADDDAADGSSADDDAADSMSLDAPDADAEDDDEDVASGEDEGPTLGDRVRALQRDDAETAEESMPVAGPGQEESLSVLLSQGLHSQDKGLLERCLAVANENVVNRTVGMLSAADAVSLLDVAVQRLRANANRGHQLTVWIRAVLLKHTATLMATPASQPVLTSLYQTIEARVALQQPMTALAGRLDMLLAQVPEASGDEPDTSLLKGPVIHVTEEDFEAMVPEDAFRAGIGSSDEESDEGDSFEEDGAYESSDDA